MAATPFSFYRGTALVMAADLAASPSSGIRVQLCGDAHAANFGLSATPERRLLFDVNDFDETLPGPFEWDVKRLVASLELAGRASGSSRKERRKLTRLAAEAYRSAIREFTGMSTLDVWYARLDVDKLLAELARVATPKAVKVARKEVAKAGKKNRSRAQC